MPTSPSPQTLPNGRFATYTNALKALSKRTGTPLPSLVVSFGLLHELTAIVPLVGVFYASRSLGVGEGIVRTVIMDTETSSGGEEGIEGAVKWGKVKVRGWVEEGDRWAERVGRRYGFFGYEKRRPGEPVAVSEGEGESASGVQRHRIAGDVANAVVAYGVTKVSFVYMLVVRVLIDEIVVGSDTCEDWSVDVFRSCVCEGRPGTCEEGTCWSVQKGSAMSDVFMYLLVGPFTQRNQRCIANSIMPKLHFKRTPEEEEAHRIRKQEKKEPRRRKRGHYSHDNTESEASASKRRRTAEDPLEPQRKWASSDEEEEQYGPQPASSTSQFNPTSRGHKPDQVELKAELDEMRFREKMFDAFADDERLDSLEARLNDYAHVPDRWRTGTSSSSKARVNVFEDDEWLKMDPQAMDEEEYAEWIRMGMYRKTHADEYAEQQRQKAARAARRAEEKKKREETARLAKAAEEERKAKKLVRDARRWAYARDAYHEKWKILLDSNNSDTPDAEAGFVDIPWPVLEAHKERSKHRSGESVAVTVEDLTVEAISAFLLPGGRPEGDRSKKEVLRETFLRFHPDKFEGRFLRTVRVGEQEVVREGIGRVVRALNTLMAE
ncbi:hypothetical protein NP233_g4500 [Leucocoprinus birnbaumii]|uniref:NF-kappa-B inhibitor-like protein 1 n=1 Tax=Leucocoprinus birnbaumii TaxID=56174 RepID=A0AAD5VUK7_9AGAR|nr:hypothetical protein NP233_g4500 [Leucocoprinus birnbaumii]